MELKNELIEEANGVYKLKINIKEKERKTPEEFTSSIRVKTLNKAIEEEKQIEESIEVKESTNLITGDIIYESSDKTAGRYAIFIFIGIILLLIGYFIIKRN